MITKHFSWQEAIHNSGYASLHDVPEPVRQRAHVHAANMEILRRRVNGLRAQHGKPETGINILSWIRSPEHNRQVGGAADSRHIHGDACDISVQEIDRLCPWKGGRDTFDQIADNVFKNGGFGQYPAGNRHVDSRGSRARWTSFTPGR